MFWLVAFIAVIIQHITKDIYVKGKHKNVKTRNKKKQLLSYLPVSVLCNKVVLLLQVLLGFNIYKRAKRRLRVLYTLQFLEILVSQIKTRFSRLQN